MSYAEYTDLETRYDAREIKQLSSDTETPSASSNNAVVLAALEDASGDIDAALLKGGRYTVAQLAALTGNSLAKLKRMCCELAMVYLMERRPELTTEQVERHAAIRKRHLDPLRLGEDVFSIDAAIDAGKMSHDGPTSVEVSYLNLTRSYSEGHYYPRRRDPLLG